MGKVYLAHDTQLDREVALKTPSFRSDRNEDMIARFYREARSAARIHHRNICPIFDVGEIDGHHFISMGFIQGRSLADVILPEKLPPTRTSAILVHRLATALAEAHRHNVVHRDLKPANIMIDQKREPVVMDFGLARQTDVESRVTQSGMVIGTPAYMSPEQLSGNPGDIGPSVDIYALGVILYELLTGRLPFTGGIAQVIQQIMHDAPTPPNELRPEVDARLVAICGKMMAKSRLERYQSMDDVAAELKNYLMQNKKPAQTGRQESQAASVQGGVTQTSETRALNAFFATEAPQQVPPQAEPGEHASRKPSAQSLPQAAPAHLGRARTSRSRRRRSNAGKRKLIAAGVAAGLVLSMCAVYFLTRATRGTDAVETAAKEPKLEAEQLDNQPAETVGPEQGKRKAAGRNSPQTESYRVLFNGRDLNGWTVKGNPAWVVRDGILVARKTQRPGWLMSEAEYQDFELELEYQLSSGGNSGVFLRAWPNGNVTGGDFHEIQLHDDTAPSHKTLDGLGSNGSLYGQIAASPVLRPPPNQWHRLRISLVGEQLKVWVNGRQVLDGKLPPSKQSGGHIGLQLHRSRVEFRNIRIREFK